MKNRTMWKLPKKLILAVAGIAVLAEAIVVAVVNTPSVQAQAQPPLPAFEVASIRPHQGPLTRIADFSISGSRVMLGGYSPFLLILEAYHLKNYQVSAASQDLPLNNYYDIAAIAPATGALTRDESKQMLQALLADRFKVQFHREMREIPVYFLVVDKSGASLKPGGDETPCASRIGPVRPEDRNYRYQFTNCPLDSLVSSLQTDRPILDKTGFSGRYDITISATPDFKMRDASEPGDISIRDAIRQLGLRMEPHKAMIEVLVIDHVEKPTEN